MTYNVHGCVGTDGIRDVDRVARVIASARPDVVALQEVDVGRARSDGADQPELLAARVGMTARFGHTIETDGGRYGNAVLSRWPLSVVREGRLPGDTIRERRGALWVDVELEGCRLAVLATHLSLNRRDRVLQSRALLSEAWIGDPRFAPGVLVGDLNAGPRAAAYGLLAEKLTDGARLVGLKARRTWPARFPVVSLDHVLVTDGVDVRSVRVLSSPAARLASDHLPLVADVAVVDARGGAA